MATTTNFGWETPDDTDLVKDGAAAMRTLGNAIDTSLVDLKGGTTNQVLAKNSNSDLDFKWVADATGIPATIFDAKGDLIAATAADTADRLAVGANGTVLTADSTTATGLKWASASASSPTWSLLNSGGTALSGSQTVTISGISAKKLLVLISGASTISDLSLVQVRVNSISTNDYTQFGIANTPASTIAAANFGASARWTDLSGIYVGRTGNSAADTVSGAVFIDGADSSGWKNFDCFGSGITSGHSQTQYATAGIIEMSAAITSVNIFNADGNFDAGTVYVLGAN